MKSKYFTRKEFKCKCGECGFDSVDVDLLNLLEAVREYFDSPVTINSACRCMSHNEKIQKENNSKYVKFSSKSQHLYGKAADIVIKNVTPERVQDYLDTKYPNSKGLGYYNSFTHIDVRQDRKRW